MATVRQLRDANSQGAVPPTRQRRYVSAVRLHATGVAGYIGCRHARRLVGDGHEVLGIDNLNQCYDGRLKLDRLRELGVVTTETRSEGTGPVDANDSRLRVLRLDLVDQERVLALFAKDGSDAVCHLAALADPWSYLNEQPARVWDTRLQLGLRAGPLRPAPGEQRGGPSREPVCGFETVERG